MLLLSRSTFRSLLLLVLFSWGNLTIASDPSVLTLKAVWEIALKTNPTFAEFSANREWARAAVVEARAWRNPEFDSALKYFSGDDDDVEYELALRQPLELSSKRRARRAAAAALETVAEQEESSFRARLWFEVVNAYRSVKYREQTIALSTQNFTLAEDIVEIVKKRVESGSGRPIDITRAAVEMLKAKKQIQAEQRMLNVAREVINALCGRGLPIDFQLVDSLPTQFEPLQIEALLAKAQVQHPELQRLAAVRNHQELALEREHVAWYPDLTPGIGYDRETDADRYLISFGMEIPLWNKNQGGIAKAKAELSHIDAQILKANQEIIREVKAAAEVYAGALEQIGAFDELRKAAMEALKTETFLYEQGEVDFISLLDARRTAQETEAEYLAALYEAQLTQLELEQSSGITGDEK